MPSLIQLSDTTRELILQHRPMEFDGFDADSMSIERKHVLSGLRALNVDVESLSFPMESLRASLLSDLRHSMIHQPEKPESDWFSKLKLLLLTISGTILGIYGGYDAVSPFLHLAFLPVWLAPVVVVLFIVCSVASFYAFDLSQISENIGVSFAVSRYMLDVLYEQAQDIQLIGKYIKKRFHQCTPEELDELHLMTKVLQEQQERLCRLQMTYQNQLNDGKVSIAKWIASIVTGILFFSSGFFVGQDPTIAICSLLGLSASTMAMPVFILCFISGAAAFALYWYVERPGVDHFISRLFGLDKEKIAALDQHDQCELTGEERNTTSELAQLIQQLETKKIKQQSISTQIPSEDVVFRPLFSRQTCEMGTQTELVDDSSLVLQV